VIRRRLFLLTISLVGLHFVVCGQPIYFRHYEVESGLSNNAVISSIQDKFGFMWFGTQDGLNRFDGTNFKTYRFPGNNFIHALQLDNSGALLACTEKEIYRYNEYSDTFKLVLKSKYFPIDEMAVDKLGNIWFNAGYILCEFSSQESKLHIYREKKYGAITSIVVDRQGTIWTSTLDGRLIGYDELHNSRKTFDLFSHTPNSPSRYINNMLCTLDGKILIGTNQAGVKIFNIKNQTYQDIHLCCDSLVNLFVRSFLQISDNEIWIGTENGIFSYNLQTRQSIKIKKNSSDQYALSDNVVYTLYKDREGGIWVGTYFGGINYFPRQFTPFQKYYHQPGKNSISGNIVREITKDRFDNLWISIEDGGLNKLDAQTGQFITYKPDNTPQTIAYYGVHTLMAVDNILWVGTYQHGLDLLNIQSGKVIKHYGESVKTGLRSNFPFFFLKSKSKGILVGTMSGIYKYVTYKDKFEPVTGFRPDDFYRWILEDRQGDLWTSVPGHGIYVSNHSSGQVSNFRFDPTDSTSIASDKVNSIFQDNKGGVWFATENGLCLWQPSKRNFKRFGMQNGFPTNFLLAMSEDKKGRLWISTAKGLVCFNPMSGSAIVYTTANGLLSDQFNFSSAYRDHDGRMYFGSAKGMISFQPEDFIKDTFVPTVYLTGLDTDDRDTDMACNTLPARKSVFLARKIVLKNSQSSFSLEFAAVGYTAPQNLEYAYRVDGLINHWTYIRTKKINFTKLQPGTYLFRIKASSSAGVWNKKETVLTIEILPPWWLSRWAYFLYAIFIIGVSYWIFAAYHKRMESRNLRKIELLEIAKEKELLQMELRKEKEVLESKIEFFTQVAHEIRTPITLIKIPLSKIIRKTKGITEIENSLQIINNNTERLIELSNQFLDFRQTELEAYHLTLEKVDAVHVLKETCHNFAALAKKNKVKLELLIPMDHLVVSVDNDAFKKILYNLFSNAVKYAATIIKVNMENHSNHQCFSITIKNDGHLVPEHLKEKIFEPFYRVKETDSKTGTGIGLALARSLAQIHNGTLNFETEEHRLNVFVLTLPVNDVVMI